MYLCVPVCRVSGLSLSRLIQSEGAEFRLESLQRNLMLNNVHEDLSLPKEIAEAALVKGNYQYYHYLCDGHDDRGWGCGYRTLQTLCSWVKGQLESKGGSSREVPDILSMQQALLDMKDKPGSFAGSKEWIGSFEACLIIDHFYNVPCKIIHLNYGSQLQQHSDDIITHFRIFGSPIMMGGNTDSSSKGILGVSRIKEKIYLLVLDPHFVGKPNRKLLQDEGWVQWKSLSDFSSSSFYNLCCPQLEAS